MEQVNFTEFNSHTYGRLNLDGVVARILEYMAAAPGFKYDLTIGTDSMASKHEADFVTAIVVHRKNAGAIYFWSKQHLTNLYTLRDRMVQEAMHSLNLAEQLMRMLREKEIVDFNFAIHVDVGNNGETRQMIQEIVGMVTGFGYMVLTKPNSYAASSVADRHT